MHVVWITDTGGSGIAAQTDVIADALADEDLTFDVLCASPTNLDRAAPLVRDDAGVAHPTETLPEAILALGPDIVVCHTSNPNVRQAARTVQPFTTTVARLGVNFREQVLAGSGYVQQLPDIIDYLNGVDHIIASSPRTKRAMRTHGIDEERLTVIPTAIPTDDVREPELPVPETVGTIGRIGKIKNQFPVLEAIVGLRELDPPLAPDLHIAGDKNDQLYATLPDLLPALVPNSQINPRGFVEDPLENFYPDLGVHCLPSWTENCPQTVLEAAISGVPTIVSDLAWADAYPEVEFLRCNPDDPWQWAEEIHALLTDDEYYLAVAEAQQEQVVSNYDSAHIAPMYVALFEELLDETAAFKLDASEVTA